MKKNERVCSREVGEKVTKKQEVTVSLRKGEIKEIHLNIEEKNRRKRKKVKDYDVRSKEKEKVQQISSYNKQKLESEEKSKLKTCITGKEKDGQNVSRIPNQRKVSQIPRPIKKESDITNRQKSVKKGFNIAIQQQPAQRGNTIQNLSVPVLYALKLFPKKKIKMSVQQEIGVIKKIIIIKWSLQHVRKIKVMPRFSSQE